MKYTIYATLFLFLMIPAKAQKMSQKFDNLTPPLTHIDAVALMIYDVPEDLALMDLTEENLRKIARGYLTGAQIPVHSMDLIASTEKNAPVLHIMINASSVKDANGYIYTYRTFLTEFVDLKNGGETVAVSEQFGSHYGYKKNRGELRSTIIKVMKEHLGNFTDEWYGSK